jgi:glycerol uptake facilitator-like aquaporin
MTRNLARRAIAEFTGTLFLLAAVVGSGIMGERLAAGNTAIALLANSIATGAALVAIILAFGPISGAHLNPAVTLARCLTNTFAGIRPRDVVPFIIVQLVGAVAATLFFNSLSPAHRVSENRAARSASPTTK